MSVQVSLVSPIANAGNPQTITLPTNSVTLNGSGSTGATTYSWTNVSGPNIPPITTPTAVSTTVNGLIAGNYIFQLSINSGASTNQTNVTVLPAAAPVANAGASQTITLPTNSVTVSGAASSGTISSYLWTRVSGPNNPVFGSSSAVSTTLSSLIAGTYVIQLSLNGGTSIDTLQIIVNPTPPPSTSTITIFGNQVPASTTYNDGSGIELGLKFRSTTAGYITGLRFYKTQNNFGTHIGQLYSSTGTLIVSATFTNESLVGWQTVQLPTPIPIAANTTYIIAYFNASGYYTATLNATLTAIVNSPLTALADGFDGPNGLYIYTSTPTFPNVDGGRHGNPWLDIVFSLPNPGTLPGHLHHSIYFKAAP